MYIKLERMLREELQINIVLWPVGFCPIKMCVFLSCGVCSLFIFCDFVCKEYVLWIMPGYCIVF